MMFCKTEDERLGIWKNIDIAGSQVDREDPTLNWDLLKFYFRELTLVLLRPAGTECTCELFAKLGVCPHHSAVEHLFTLQKWFDTSLPQGIAGNRGSVEVSLLRQISRSLRLGRMLGEDRPAPSPRARPGSRQPGTWPR
jgi:hypothetical protein